MNEPNVDVAADYLRGQCADAEARGLVPLTMHMVTIVLDALEAERVAHNVTEGWRFELAKQAHSDYQRFAKEWRQFYDIRRAFRGKSPAGGSTDDVPKLAALAAQVVTAAEAFRAAYEVMSMLDPFDDESKVGAAGEREEGAWRALCVALDELQAMRGEGGGG